MFSWLLVPLALVAAAILIIVLTKLLCPTAFFKLPNGFILHAMTGGKLPPFFCHWPFEDKYFGKWCRDGDVVVCVASKSGTTWLMNIVHQIRTLGDPKGFLKHNTHTTPWPECSRYPGETVEEALEHLLTLDGTTNPEYPLRVFKSHYRPRVDGTPWSQAIKTDAVVPVRQKPKVKYIACAREGKDVLASFYPFFAAHRQEWKDLWGSFPPTFKDFNECFKFFTEDQPGFYHGYIADWWAYRHDPNVLMLHYADLKKDIKGSLRKIARFVGVDVPESAWPLIESKVSLKWMQENEDIFKYDMTTKYFEGNVMSDEKGSFVRKGALGEGKSLLSPEQEKKWQEMNDQYFGDKPGLAEWALNGGPLAPLTEAEKKTGGLTTPLLSKQ